MASETPKPPESSRKRYEAVRFTVEAFTRSRDEVPAVKLGLTVEMYPDNKIGLTIDPIIATSVDEAVGIASRAVEILRSSHLPLGLNPKGPESDGMGG